MSQQPTPRQLADAAGITRVFAWEVLNSKKKLSDEKVALAWVNGGWKLGRLVGSTDEFADEFSRRMGARS